MKGCRNLGIGTPMKLLCDVFVEFAAYVAEGDIDLARDSAHPDGCGERDDRDDQNVFDQILARVLPENLPIDVKLLEKILHIQLTPFPFSHFLDWRFTTRHT